MLGQAVVYDRVPYFYTDQYDLGMEYSGYVEPDGYDSVVFRGPRRWWTARRRSASRSGSAGDRVLAGMNVNIWDVTDQIQALVRAGYAGRGVDCQPAHRPVGAAGRPAHVTAGAARTVAARLPGGPGVYRFRDARGRVLYVGRAVNLRRRVISYWGDLGDRPYLTPHGRADRAGRGGRLRLRARGRVAGAQPARAGQAALEPRHRWAGGAGLHPARPSGPRRRAHRHRRQPRCPLLRALPRWAQGPDGGERPEPVAAAGVRVGAPGRIRAGHGARSGRRAGAPGRLRAARGGGARAGTGRGRRAAGGADRTPGRGGGRARLRVGRPAAGRGRGAGRG